MLESWEPRRRALVIAGNARLRRDTCLALEARGIETITAPDGDLGLHLVAEELLALDLLVVDLDAPRRDGWEILHVIRERGNEQDLRVLVTTDQPAAVRGNLHAMGADAVVDRRRGPPAIADESAALLAAG
ncbi:MAG TPA: histidine kinase, partial [Anaeromyxobacteraceae bacterium]|nr:histidine kinase [Anaeromyxobacteraceae bacterium]